MAIAKEKGKVERLQEFYDSILEERSQRLGISLEEAAKLENDQPLFVQASERRARRLGLSTEQLLNDYVIRIKESSYPSPFCLQPEEVQAFSDGGELSSEQKTHLETCQPCRSLLESSRLSPERLEQMVENIRHLSAQVYAKSAMAKAASSATSSGASGLMAAAANFLRLK